MPLWRMSTRFRLIDLARTVAAEIQELQARGPALLKYDRQLYEASRSIVANIREAYGSVTRAQRNQFLGYSRASSDETDEHLRGHHAAKRIATPTFWRLHNRLIVINRMLTRLMD